MNRIPVCIFDPSRTAFENGYLFCDGDDVLDVRTDSTSPGGLYICPGLIDSHAHIYPGVTELGVCADEVGIAQGVHLVVDAGSAGAVTLPCFRDVIAPACGTQIKAFLHISKIGFVTKQPYADPRFLDAGLAADTIRRDTGGFLVGLKVCSSGTIVENVGLAPLEQTVRAAELAGCRMMVHLAEGPPSNGQTLPMLRRGDIITHVFHGAFLREASLRANRGAEPLQEYCKLDNLLWDSRGAPVKELEQAIERGVRLDVGHGAASFDKEIAARVIAAGFRDFFNQYRCACAEYIRCCARHAGYHFKISRARYDTAGGNSQRYGSPCGKSWTEGLVRKFTDTCNDLLPSPGSGGRRAAYGCLWPGDRNGEALRICCGHSKGEAPGAEWSGSCTVGISIFSVKMGHRRKAACFYIPDMLD